MNQIYHLYIYIYIYIHILVCVSAERAHSEGNYNRSTNTNTSWGEEFGEELGETQKGYYLLGGLGEIQKVFIFREGGETRKFIIFSYFIFCVWGWGRHKKILSFGRVGGRLKKLLFVGRPGGKTQKVIELVGGAGGDSTIYLLGGLGEAQQFIFWASWGSYLLGGGGQPQKVIILWDGLGGDSKSYYLLGGQGETQQDIIF